MEVFRNLHADLIISELHLLEYKQSMLEYLSYFNSARPNPFNQTYLQEFSAPMDEDGYGDSPITNDLITDIYLDFITKTRQEESVEHCKTREGIFYSFSFYVH